MKLSHVSVLQFCMLKLSHRGHLSFKMLHDLMLPEGARAKRPLLWANWKQMLG